MQMSKNTPSKGSDSARMNQNDYIKSLRNNGSDINEDIELKIQKLENNQFEDAFVLLTSFNLKENNGKPLDIINIESIKSFVFALNSLVENWMLIEQPVKRIILPKPEP